MARATTMNSSVGTRRQIRAKRHKGKTEMIHVRVQRTVKAGAQQAFDAMGIPMSAVLNYVLKFVAVERRLPFSFEEPNAKTRAAIEEARRGGLPSFNSMSELMADLNAED
jgi:DNA-damage-inducible protein J